MRIFKKFLVWLLFSIAMLAWGFLYASFLAMFVHQITQGIYIVAIASAICLGFITKEAYFWVANPPWKAKL